MSVSKNSKCKVLLFTLIMWAGWLESIYMPLCFSPISNALLICLYERLLKLKKLGPMSWSSSACYTAHSSLFDTLLTWGTGPVTEVKSVSDRCLLIWPFMFPPFTIFLQEWGSAERWRGIWCQFHGATNWNIQYLCHSTHLCQYRVSRYVV